MDCDKPQTHLFPKKQSNNSKNVNILASSFGVFLSCWFVLHLEIFWLNTLNLTSNKWFYCMIMSKLMLNSLYLGCLHFPSSVMKRQLTFSETTMWSAELQITAIKFPPKIFQHKIKTHSWLLLKEECSWKHWIKDDEAVQCSGNVNVYCNITA